MLRPLQAAFFHPRVSCATLSVSGTTLTVVGGCGAISATRTGTGVYAVTLNVPGVGIVVGAATPLSTTDGYTAAVTDETNTGCNVKCYSETTATDMSVELHLVRLHTSEKGLAKPSNQVKMTWNKSRVIGGVVQTDATVLQGLTDFSCVTGGTGIFTVTFKRPFSQDPIIQVQATTSGGRASVYSKTKTGCVIHVTDAAQSLAAIGFHIFVTGSDGIEPGDGKTNHVVMSTQLKAYLGIYRDGSTGTEHAAVNTASTGITTLTPTGQAFGPLDVRRNIICVGSTGDTAYGNLAVTAASTTAVTVRATNEAGTLTTDPVNLIMLGFQSVDEQ